MITTLDRNGVNCETYLLAVVVLLEKDPPGGCAGLVERILDERSSAPGSGPRWRRFYTDNETILGGVIGESIWLLVQREIRFSRDDAREVIHCVAERTRQWETDSWKLHDRTFMIGGVAGCVVECWATRTFTTSPILMCPECKQSYDLSRNTGLVTRELALEVLVERGNNIWTFRDPDSPPPIPEDLVYCYPEGNAKHPQQFMRSLHQVLLDLQHEHPRRWRCMQNHLHGYPGGFFRHVFTHVTIQPQQPAEG
jgi:hypothetical protein